MIESVEEFLQLRLSQNPYEYHRAAQEETPLQIWLEAIAKPPEMKTWVAHNKDEKPAEASLIATAQHSHNSQNWLLLATAPGSRLHHTSSKQKCDQSRNIG